MLDKNVNTASVWDPIIYSSGRWYKFSRSCFCDKHFLPLRNANRPICIPTLVEYSFDRKQVSLNDNFAQWALYKYSSELRHIFIACLPFATRVLRISNLSLIFTVFDVSSVSYLRPTFEHAGPHAVTASSPAAYDVGLPGMQFLSWCKFSSDATLRRRSCCSF